VASKWLILAIAVMTSVWFIYHKGELNERQKWELATQEHAIQVQKALQDATTKTMQETAKSNAYASFIESEYNAKVNQLHATSVKLDGLRTNKICRGRGSSALPDNNHTSVHDETATDDEAGFSDEFRQFIESQIKRDQLNELWIESAVKAANQLCQQPNVICTK